MLQNNRGVVYPILMNACCAWRIVASRRKHSDHNDQHFSVATTPLLRLKFTETGSNLLQEFRHQRIQFLIGLTAFAHLLKGA
jgi:hypothetical protein